MRQLFLLYLLLLTACGGPKQGASEQGDAPTVVRDTTSREVPFQLRLPLPPADLEGDEQRIFLRDHYWDNFPFADSTILRRIDSLDLMRLYMVYVGQLLTPADTAAMRHLMQRASASKPLFERFHQMGELFLYDPNSPMRSDELYGALLEQVVASPLYDAYERLAPAYDLELVRQNRVGEPANDFRYTLFDGTSASLYALKAPYTLLFISNPGCPMCRSICEQIGESPYLSELIERGELRVLMLYPDEDLSEWYAHRDEIPSSWIYAYDKGMLLQRNRLYDLKAIPSLYLLDSRKRVMLKDVVDVALVEHTLLERP